MGGPRPKNWTDVVLVTRARAHPLFGPYRALSIRSPHHTTARSTPMPEAYPHLFFFWSKLSTPFHTATYTLAIFYCPFLSPTLMPGHFLLQLHYMYSSLIGLFPSLFMSCPAAVADSVLHSPGKLQILQLYKCFSFPESFRKFCGILKPLHLPLWTHDARDLNILA